MKKHYIIDTNVMIHDPHFLYKFEDNHIIIPLICIEELDKLKNAKGVIGYQARENLRIINRFRSLETPLEKGVDLPGGGTLRVEMNHMDFTDMPDALDASKNDNKILAIVYNLKRINDKKEQPTILVSKDLAMSIKGDSLGLEVQDYENDKVDINRLYEGYEEVVVKEEELLAIATEGLPVEALPEGVVTYENHFIEARDEEGEERILARISNARVVPLMHSKRLLYGIKPLNREQKFAFELLFDESVRLVTMTGGAGSGKTLMAMAAALELYYSGFYKKIVLVRPVVPAGEDIGFLPGTEDEKLKPWMGPFYDSVETLLYLKGRYAKGIDHTPETFINQLKDMGTLEIKTLNYMRGRTLERAIVVVDEAQQITPHLAKLMLTRAGNDSKFIFLGDPSDNQIDSVLVDEKSNGLVYLIDRMKSYDITGHVTLKHVERSPLAMLAEASL